MRRFVHKFLTWFPAAIGGGAVAISAVWTEAKDWVGATAGWLWAQMNSPWIAFFVFLSVAAYVAAIIWTGQERAVNAPLQARDAKPTLVDPLVAAANARRKEAVALAQRGFQIVATIRHHRGLALWRVGQAELDGLVDTVRAGASLLVSIDKFGIETPRFQTDSAERMAIGLLSYLPNICQLLWDGHLDVAQAKAREMADIAQAAAAQFNMNNWRSEYDF